MGVVERVRWRGRRIWRPVLGFVREHAIITAMVLAVAAAGLGNLQLLFTQPAPSNWSGFLQYNESAGSTVPTGRILSNYFRVSQDDLTTFDQNLSATSWNATTAFLSASGTGPGLQLSAIDQGNYSTSPFRTVVHQLTEPYNRLIEIRYVYVHQSNFGISAWSPSGIITSLFAWRPTPYPSYVLRLQVNTSGSAAFSTVFHYTASTTQSTIELHASGLSLPGPNGTAVNLTGNAVLDIAGFSEAYVGLYGYGEILPYLVGAHLEFQQPLVRLENASGYLIDQAGKPDTPNGSTLDFGHPFTFDLDLVYPTNPQGSMMTVAITSADATLVEFHNGNRIVPDQQAPEDPVWQFGRLVATGLASFSSGVFVSIGLMRRRGRSRWGS